MTDWVTARARAPHGLHSLLLAFPIVLFSGAVLTDIVYLRSSEIQWTNFSAWLITIGLVFGGLLALWALVALVLGFRGTTRKPRLVYFGVVVAMCLVGLVNAFKHSQDAWSSVEAFGLTLSIVTAILALAAGFLHHMGSARREIVR